MTLQRVLLVIGMALSATACGLVGDLEPRSGNALPPQAYGQTTTQSAGVLTTPSAQARPGRSDELLKRSERRTDDPFDVAPGEQPKPLNPEDQTLAAKTDPE
jgi:hypothetical protein